jgi:hypothetical protein
LHHAIQKGYTKKKDFTKSDYEHIGKQHCFSGRCGEYCCHHTAHSYSLLEDVEQIDELHEKSVKQLSRHINQVRVMLKRNI